jgi:hypothetical protein
MNNTNQERTILSIAPSTTGFGFALMRKAAILVDYGMKWNPKKSDKNKYTLKAVEKMINRHSPGVIVLPNASERGSRRAERIRKLVREIASLARERGITVKLVPQKELQEQFFENIKGTKYDRAKILAQRFPQDLAHLLPSKRQPWMPEDPKMDMFDAVAFGTVFSSKK